MNLDFLAGMSPAQVNSLYEQEMLIRTAAQQQAATQLGFNPRQLGAYGIAAGLGAAVGGGLGGLIGGEDGVGVGAVGGMVAAPAMAYGANALLQKYLGQEIAANAMDQARDRALLRSDYATSINLADDPSIVQGVATPLRQTNGKLERVPIAELDPAIKAQALLEEYGKSAIVQQELAKAAQSAAIQGGAAVAPLTAGYQLIRNRFGR